MKVSTKGRYALRLMIDLAQHHTGEAVSLKDISKRQDISVKFLEQIVSLLSKSGLVRSVRGANGGYILTKEPKDYSAGEVLRVVEGELAPVACMQDTPNACQRYAQCTTIHFWEGLGEMINNYVDKYTLQDFVDDAEKNIPMDFSI